MDKLEYLLTQARKERDESEAIVKWLERQIAQMGTRDLEAPVALATPVAKAIRRRKAPVKRHMGPSVTTLVETILRGHSEGLMTQQLIAELRKLGYESRSKNPPNTLNSILRPSPIIKRSAEGRWILIKQVHDSNGTTEETAIH
ncbi:MAG: hypothetical protein ABSG46_00255 [Candidatus Binataceae bacterium]|jgi:hypothetical protein